MIYISKSGSLRYLKVDRWWSRYLKVERCVDDLDI